MQNKPNFLRSQMNVSTYTRKDYENISDWTFGENKPNSKPIQTQSNPISSKAKMSVNIYYTEDYENKWLRRVRKNKPNTKPIQTQSKPVLSAPVLSKVEGVEWANFRTLFPLTARPVRKKMLSSNEAGDYNGIFSQISFFQRTPIERG